jgi:hypothetical protein
MSSFALESSGLFLPQRKLVRPSSPWIPTPAVEEYFGEFDRKDRNTLGALILKPIPERMKILQMAGTMCNFLTKSLLDLALGKTAYTGPTTSIYFGLWAAAIDDTLVGNTGSECAYTSYARLALTDNATIFAAGTGTTTYTKTFPSDAVKSWATSTGTGTNNTVTYMGMLDGNAGTTADKGLFWCTITSVTINNGDTPQLAQNAVTVVGD